MLFLSNLEKSALCVYACVRGSKDLIIKINNPFFRFDLLSITITKKERFPKSFLSNLGKMEKKKHAYIREFPKMHLRI